MEITTQIFAIMQILIESHWKVRKCKWLSFLTTLHYPDKVSNPRPFDRWISNSHYNKIIGTRGDKVRSCASLTPLKEKKIFKPVASFTMGQKFDFLTKNFYFQNHFLFFILIKIDCILLYFMKLGHKSPKYIEF